MPLLVPLVLLSGVIRDVGGKGEEAIWRERERVNPCLQELLSQQGDGWCMSEALRANVPGCLLNHHGTANLFGRP